MNSKINNDFNRSILSYNLTGITLRKKIIDERGKVKHLSKNQMIKQTLKVHKKIKRIAPVYTHATVERDPDTIVKYHAHMLIYHHPNYDYTDILQKYVGGETWYVTNYVNYDVWTCNGEYGEVSFYDVISVKNILSYFNKEYQTYTWI